MISLSCRPRTGGLSWGCKRATARAELVLAEVPGDVSYVGPAFTVAADVVEGPPAREEVEGRSPPRDLRRAISAARSPPQPASSSRAPPARLIATPVRGSTTRPPEPVPAAPSTGSLLDAHLHCNALYRLRIFHAAPPGVPPVTTAIPAGETSAGRARNHGDHRREGVGGRGPVGRTRRSSPGAQELIRTFVG